MYAGKYNVEEKRTNIENITHVINIPPGRI